MVLRYFNNSIAVYCYATVVLHSKHFFYIPYILVIWQVLWYTASQTGAFTTETYCVSCQ
jgi:hypothetical protein